METYRRSKQRTPVLLFFYNYIQIHIIQTKPLVFQNNFSIVDRIRNDLRSKSKSPDVPPGLEPVSILPEELNPRSEFSQFLSVPSKSSELQNVQDLTPEKSNHHQKSPEHQSTRNRSPIILYNQSKSVKSSENSKYTNSTNRTLSPELGASLKSNIKSDNDTVLGNSKSTKPDKDVAGQSSSLYHQNNDCKIKLTKGKVSLNLIFS